MSHEQILEVDRVRKSYARVEAVCSATLNVGRGQVHCLVGPSGSGKSTLLRLIAGLESAEEGSITIAGRSVAASGVHVRPEQRSVGFVFQDYALFPHLNIERNILFGMSEGSTSERRATVRELLASVDLEGFERVMPHTLSGGQQQRVALVRALARRPDVMLLDEPFSALDAKMRDEVRDRTLRVLRESNVATVMVTHEPREALACGDIVSVMRDGCIVQTGTPDEIYGRPATREIAEMFGRINRVECTVRDGAVATGFGSFPAPAMPEGHVVEVLVRPEFVKIHRGTDKQGVAANIEKIEPDAGTVLLHLVTSDGTHVQARHLPGRDWTVGMNVSLEVAAADSSVVPRPAIQS